MKEAAFIFSLLATIALGFAIIPLAWCIPMTMKCYEAWKEDKPASVALGVCQIFFCSQIAGILLLIDTGMAEEKGKPVEVESKPLDE